MFMEELDSIRKPKEEEKRIQLDTTTEMFNPLRVTTPTWMTATLKS